MANVSSTTNKSLYRKIDENGNYSCVIDLENGTNTNLTTENKTIVGAINEINNKTTFIPVISVNKEISNDFIFDISAIFFDILAMQTIAITTGTARTRV